MAATEDLGSTERGKLYREVTTFTVNELVSIAYPGQVAWVRSKQLKRCVDLRAFGFGLEDAFALNLLGYAHLYDNREVEFRGCFDARSCVICGLWSLRQPFSNEGLYLAHNFDEPGLRSYPHPTDGNLIHMSQCTDCHSVWNYEKTHSKDKLL